jgi:hypothetical protein
MCELAEHKFFREVKLLITEKILFLYKMELNVNLILL